eukprot:1961967-Pyramimonas_sp.AAC.1
MSPLEGCHARCERGTDALHMCHPGLQFFMEELKKDVMVVPMRYICVTPGVSAFFVEELKKDVMVVPMRYIWVTLGVSA